MTILPRQAQDKNIGETRVFRRRRYFQNIRVATSADKGCMRVNITDHFHNSTFAVPLQAAGCESALHSPYQELAGRQAAHTSRLAPPALLRQNGLFF